MDIKNRLTQQEKQELKNLAIEHQVISNLLKNLLQNKAKQILGRLGLSTGLYELRFNSSKDQWEAVLKEEALIVPSTEVRKKIERGKN